LLDNQHCERFPIAKTSARFGGKRSTRPFSALAGGGGIAHIAPHG
jgi:hypothetical protein